jgi:hypothetical protein
VGLEPFNQLWLNFFFVGNHKKVIAFFKSDKLRSGNLAGGEIRVRNMLAAIAYTHHGFISVLMQFCLSFLEFNRS